MKSTGIRSRLVMFLCSRCWIGAKNPGIRDLGRSERQVVKIPAFFSMPLRGVQLCQPSATTLSATWSRSALPAALRLDQCAARPSGITKPSSGLPPWRGANRWPPAEPSRSLRGNSSRQSTKASRSKRPTDREESCCFWPGHARMRRRQRMRIKSSAGESGIHRWPSAHHHPFARSDATAFVR